MTRAAALATTSERLGNSTLARSGGVLAVRLVDDVSLAALQADARDRRAGAVATSVAHHDGAERGGSPDRALDTAVGGPALQALYHDGRLLDLLAALTDVEWAQSGAEGTYSYYCRPGHHLGLHRDIDECDLAVVLCVFDDRPRGSDDAGVLQAYPGRAYEPLEHIRATPNEGATRVPLAPAEAVVLLGGLVPHEVPAVGERHLRVVAPLCFRARA